MEKREKILFIAHSSPQEYAYKRTVEYLEKFTDVEVRSASKDLPPFPSSLSELRPELVMKVGRILDQAFSNAIIEAEQDGYGAVVTASESDPGVEVREKASVLVVGMAWANYVKAIDLGGKFSVLSPFPMGFFVEQIRKYGFAENFTSFEALDFDPLKCLAKKEKPDFEELTKSALRRVKRCAEKGAKVILIGCGSPELSEFAPKLNQATMKEYNIPVLTPIDTCIEVARRLLRKHVLEKL